MLLLLTFAFLGIFSAAQHPTNFIFNDFNETTLILMQGASIHSNVLRLTNSSEKVIGRALYPTPLPMKKTNDTITVSSFSTTFVFAILPPTHNGGEGLTFLMTPHSSPVTASYKGYLGLLNDSADGKPYNHLFAVEFDTHKNQWTDDTDGNHVGVDIDTIKSYHSKMAGYQIGEHYEKLNLQSGQNIQAWIDYDAHHRNLSVTIALAGMARPIKPLIYMEALDLSHILQEEMYVGFSAATGCDEIEEHYILAWSFKVNGMAPPLNLSRIPSFLNNNSKKQSTRIIVCSSVSLFILVLLACLFLLLGLKRSKHRDVFEERELEYWPHRFSYHELKIATQGFREEWLLGCGGFGKVYRGVMSSSGLEVAIKCIAGEIDQGMKDFVAEISSLGRLQHRNLVQLRGWCRNKNQLFVVYDYMANGSLDRMIFGNPKTLLGWPQRYAILKGVAAGLLYLHEEWDRRVIHRDLKSSNVLLDSEFNPKLGDFGLARLYDHNEKPQTSVVVGTLGYIAPELVRTGKATTSTDVFSFGIVLLEVASGRQPVDAYLAAEQVILVDWVNELNKEGRIMDAVDPKLCGDYNVEEMERVLKLGIVCSHQQQECRPSMRQVSRILQGEVSLPHIAPENVLPLPNANPFFHAKYSDNTANTSLLNTW